MIPTGFWHQQAEEPVEDITGWSIIYANNIGDTAHSSIGWYTADNMWTDNYHVANNSLYAYFIAESIFEYFPAGQTLDLAYIFDEPEGPDTENVNPPAISHAAAERMSDFMVGPVFTTLFRFEITNTGLMGFDFQQWRAFSPAGDFAAKQIFSNRFNVLDESYTAPTEPIPP